jgi:hypothetical protein
MFNFGRRSGESGRVRIVLEVSEDQHRRLDEVSGGLGPAGFVRVVALRLAEEATAIQVARLRGAFADET